MSRIISANKLNRFWQNGVKPIANKISNSIKNRTDLMNNTEEGKLVDALAIKEALDYYNVGNKTNAQYATLEGFVTDTATDINIPHVGRCKDTSANGWLGKAPFNYGNHWYRYVITYQNPYVSGSSASIYGNGIFWNSLGRMFNVIIEGNKDTGLTVTHQVLNVPPIKTRQDLMANTVSGLFPDALAVKDAINLYNCGIYSRKQYATLEEFVMDMAGDAVTFNYKPYKAGLLQDTGGWGPKKIVNAWYKYIVIQQNHYTEGQQYSTSCNGIFMDDAGGCWITHISGKKDTGLTANYKSLTSYTNVSLMEKCESVITPTIARMVLEGSNKHVYFMVNGKINAANNTGGEINILNNISQLIPFRNPTPIFSRTQVQLFEPLSNHDKYIKEIYGYTTATRMCVSMPNDYANKDMVLYIKGEMIFS